MHSKFWETLPSLQQPSLTLTEEQANSAEIQGSNLFTCLKKKRYYIPKLFMTHLFNLFLGKKSCSTLYSETYQTLNPRTVLLDGFPLQ